MIFASNSSVSFASSKARTPAISSAVAVSSVNESCFSSISVSGTESLRASSATRDDRNSTALATDVSASTLFMKTIYAAASLNHKPFDAGRV